MSQADLYKFVIEGVFLDAVGAAGLVGNTLSVLVRSQPQMRSSFNCLLLGLAVTDSALILTAMLCLGFKSIYPYTGYFRYYNYHVLPHITPYGYYISYVAQTMSVYLTLMVTVERWVAVCRPFRAATFCTYSNARKWVLITTVVALIYNASKLFEVEVIKVDLDGEVVYSLNFLRSRTYVVVCNSLYMIFMCIVPFSALAVFNTCILREVWRAQAERAQMAREQQSEIGLAIMLLVIVLAFFICNLPGVEVNTCEIVLGAGFGKRIDEFRPLICTSNLLLAINHSISFVIYIVFSQKFRRSFFQMFRCPATRLKMPTPLVTLSTNNSAQN